MQKIIFFGGDSFDKAIEDLIELTNKEKQEEIEKLKKENADLRKEIEDLGNEMEELTHKLLKEKNCIRKEIALMNLSDLFGVNGNKLVRWKISCANVYKKKCDKCNQNGEILFKSPSGKQYSERCECREPFKKYFPKKVVCINFNEFRAPSGTAVSMTYQEENRGYSLFRDPIICDNFSFKDIENVLHNPKLCFTSKTKCQRFCDYMNDKNNITDDMGIMI